MSPLVRWADRQPRTILDRPGLLLGGLNLALGSVLILGGDLRTSGPSFRQPLMIMPPDAWGLLFAVGGIVCVLAADLGRAGAVAVGLGAGVHAFWSLSLITGAANDERAGLTGCVVYSWITGVHVWTGWRLARRVA